VAAEHGDLLRNDAWVVALVEAGGKQPMPEEGHLLLQRALGVDQAVGPAGLRAVKLKRLLGIEVIALQNIFLDRRRRFGVQQFLNGGLIAFRYGLFQLIARGTEARAPKQVRHQLQIGKWHFSSSSDWGLPMGLCQTKAMGQLLGVHSQVPLKRSREEGVRPESIP
jgi:hypothetical protein